MRGLVGCLVALSLGIVGLGLAPSGAASADVGLPIIVVPGHGWVGVGVGSPGSLGTGDAGGGGLGGGFGGGSGSGATTDCTNPYAAGCAGYSQVTCFLLSPPGGCPVAPAPAGGTPAAPVLPTPGQLAQQAYGELRLPSPTINRSPTERSSDPQFGGQPYTWVQLWTWFWTSPDTWRKLSKTVSAGPVSATVTANPNMLMFDPGNGGSAVSCAGPGRPWTEADGNDAPSGGGCGYRYMRVTEGSTPLTSTVTIQWSVSWVGNDGESGTLPVLRTDATSQFIVEQIQTVNR